MNHPIESVMPPDKTRTDLHFNDRNLVDLHKWTNRKWRGEKDRFASQMADLTVEWLEENYRHHPFFLWVDFFDPHEPWDPPEFMVKRYDPDYTGVPMLHPNYGKAADLSEDELHNLRAHYFAEVEMVDRQIGRVFQRIDDLGLWEESVVIFTTDHGTSLGEHDRTGKGNRNKFDERLWPPYPEVAHIPFLITGGGLPCGKKADVLSDPTDIFPTLLELADLEADTPAPLQGRSMVRYLRGESDGGEKEFVVTGSFSGVLNPKSTEPPVMYTDKWAFVPRGANGTPELYDLSVDPSAELNTVDDHPEVVKELHDKLIRWFETMKLPREVIDRFRNMIDM